MFGKNRKFYYIFCFLGIIVFLLSYTITVGIMNVKETGSFALFGDAREASNISGEVISGDSNLNFILKYKNSLDEVPLSDKLTQTLPVKQENLIGLDSKEVEDIFSNFGYRVDKFSNKDVVFVKEIGGFQYEKGSYFIGINNNYISVLKINDDGSTEVAKETIENPKSEEETFLQVKDIENKGNLLKTLYEGCGDYQFSNIQEAIEYAQALCST